MHSCFSLTDTSLWTTFPGHFDWVKLKKEKRILKEMVFWITDFVFLQERDNMQKSEFLKALSDMWKDFDSRVLRYKVLSPIVSQFSWFLLKYTPFVDSFWTIKYGYVLPDSMKSENSWQVRSVFLLLVLLVSLCFSWLDAITVMNSGYAF